MLYIQKEIQFWETDAPLPDSYKVGTMEEEYNDGAYLLLDAEQEQFHTDHPEASPLECLAEGTHSGTRTGTGRKALACP